MRVDVTFRNFGSSEPLKSYATDKISRLARYMTRPLDAQVTLSTEGGAHVADVLVRTASGPMSASETSQDDMYSAIDLLSDKLKGQALRKKGRGRGRATPTSEVVAHKEEAHSRARNADIDAEIAALED